MTERLFATRIAIATVLGTSGAVGTISSQDAPTTKQRLTLRAANIRPDIDGVIEFIRRLQPTPYQHVEVEWLIARLADPQFRVRERAFAQLRAIGIASRSQLASAADSAELEVRTRVRQLVAEIDEGVDALMATLVDVLHRAKRPGTVKPLLQLAPFCGARHFDAFAKALHDLAGDDELEILIDAIRSDDTYVRRAAVRTLGARLQPQRLDRIEPALADSDPWVRLEAVNALVRHGRRETLPVLVELLDAPTVDVRARAHSVLTALTGNRLGFAAYDKDHLRATSVARWRQWLRTHGATVELRLPLRIHDEDRAVVGFWISSSSGNAVVRCDLRGAIVRSIPCDPYDVMACPGDRVLLTERSKGQVKLLDADDRVLIALTGLSSPTDADLLPNGNLLVVEQSGNAVSEFDRTGKRVWTGHRLNNAFDAERTDRGTTLVADSSNNRVVELDREGRVVWKSATINFPNGIARLADGRMLVTDYTSGNIIMLGADGNPQWQRKVGGTVYSPRLAGGRIWVANSSEQSVMVLSLDGQPLRSIRMPLAFNDVSYVLAQ